MPSASSWRQRTISSNPCRLAALALCLLILGAALPAQASAHGISGRASLPVPAWLFAWAAAAVLIVSFVLLSVMWTSPRLQHEHERRLCAWPQALSVLGGAIGIALFALVIYAGYEGSPYYTTNFDPTFIFVIFWVGIPVSCLLFGNWFSAVSPWRAIARACSWSVGRAGVRWRAPLAYPKWLGRWPVVAGLIAFAWLELIYHDHDDPSTLASLSLAYLALMLVAMALFGIEEWSRRGDAFGGYFELFSRLSWLDARRRALWLRRPTLSGVPGAAARTGRRRAGARDHRHHDVRRRVQWGGVEHTCSPTSRASSPASDSATRLRTSSPTASACCWRSRSSWASTASGSGACAPSRVASAA